MSMPLDFGLRFHSHPLRTTNAIRPIRCVHALATVRGRLSAGCSASARSKQPIGSGHQITAAEIIDCQKYPLQIVPPDHRRNVVRSLMHGCRDMPQHRQAVVVLQRMAVVAINAVRGQGRVVTVQQGRPSLARRSGYQWTAIM